MSIATTPHEASGMGLWRCTEVAWLLRGSIASLRVPGIQGASPATSSPCTPRRQRRRAAPSLAIGTVISADMDLVGQLQPHTEVRFVEVDMAGALQARQAGEARYAKLRDVLASAA